MNIKATALSAGVLLIPGIILSGVSQCLNDSLTQPLVAKDGEYIVAAIFNFGDLVITTNEKYTFIANRHLSCCYIVYDTL